MTTYLIREENMERLEKKLATIEKKCNKSKCSFHYEVLGTEFHEVQSDDGTVYTAKYFNVEVEGTAKYNGWRFVATLDHHEAGNVVRAFDTELVIPDKYKTCGPTCEHCNKIRSRKDTYLIYNDDTQEFKQVGKSCLQEFTNGLSAEDVALLCKYYEEIEGGYGYSGPSYNRYVDVEAILRYAFECFKHWGYQKAENSYIEENGYLPQGYRSTRDRVTSYYYINRYLQQERDRLRAEMNEVGFDADSDYAKETTTAALEWIRNEDPDNEYIRNLKVICSDNYTDYRSLGILVSLTTAYNRYLGKIAAYEKKESEHKKEVEASDFVGNIKERITVDCSSFSCVSSWPTVYGMTYLYNFKDAEGNVFIWYASSPVENEDRVTSVTGTVKDHSEYRGVKQTVLTRCKVTLAPEVEKVQESVSCDVEEAVSNFLAYANA